MAATDIQTWTLTRSPVRQRSTSVFLVRCLLAAIAVLLCYQFHWEWLRYLTSEANLRLDGVLGVHLQRLSFDSVVWNGSVYRYVIACTFADVWCGALAFLWIVRRSVIQNLLSIGLFTAGLFAFNIVRLSFSDFLCAHGASWNLGHNVVSGISYFLIWTFLQWRLRTETRAAE